MTSLRADKVTMEGIRSWYEVPSVAHFCSLFRSAFNLPDLDIEELEEGLLASSTVEGSPFITDLLCRLLQGCYGRADIECYNFELYLSDILKVRYESETGRKNPMEEEKEFRKLSLRNRVEILHELCTFRLDADDAADKLKSLEADSLRIVPLGNDNSRATYWYFYGTRLYKEDAEPLPQTPQKSVNKKNKKSKQKLQEKKKKGKHTAKLKQKNKRGRRKKDESEDDSENKDVVETESQQPLRWHLICSTIEEWENLMQSFKGSKPRCERELYKLLRDEFLPAMPQLFEEKEKALKKKLLELAPKRMSSRIGRKRAEQEEQERIMKMLNDEERQDEERQEAEMQKQRDLQQHEEQRRRREERAKKKEERATRAKLREERAAYIAQGLELPPHLVVDEHSQHSNSSQNKDLDDDVMTSMFKVLETVRDHKDAWPFMDPVSDDIAPGYSEVVEKPMDLSTIEKNLSNKDYTSRGAFIEDFQLIFENCEYYNGAESEYTVLARNVEKCLHRALKRHLPIEEFDSDEEFKGTEVEMINSFHKKFRPQRAAGNKALEALHKAAEDSPRSSRSSSPYSQDELDNNAVYATKHLKLAALKGAGDSNCSKPEQNIYKANALSAEALIGCPQTAQSNLNIPTTVLKVTPEILSSIQRTLPQGTMIQLYKGQNLVNVSESGVGVSGSQAQGMNTLQQTRPKQILPAVHSSMPQIVNVEHPGPKHKYPRNATVSGSMYAGQHSPSPVQDVRIIHQKGIQGQRIVLPSAITTTTAGGHSLNQRLSGEMNINRTSQVSAIQSPLALNSQPPVGGQMSVTTRYPVVGVARPPSVNPQNSFINGQQVIIVNRQPGQGQHSFVPFQTTGSVNQLPNLNRLANQQQISASSHLIARNLSGTSETLLKNAAIENQTSVNMSNTVTNSEKRSLINKSVVVGGIGSINKTQNLKRPLENSSASVEGPPSKKFWRMGFENIDNVSKSSGQGAPNSQMVQNHSNSKHHDSVLSQGQLVISNSAQIGVVHDVKTTLSFSHPQGIPVSITTAGLGILHPMLSQTGNGHPGSARPQLPQTTMHTQIGYGQNCTAQEISRSTGMKMAGDHGYTHGGNAYVSQNMLQTQQYPHQGVVHRATGPGASGNMMFQPQIMNGVQVSTYPVINMNGDLSKTAFQ